LKHFTTRAPLAHAATFSAADVVRPTVSPFMSAASGFVQSIRTFPVRLPADRIASCAAGYGVARMMTSASAHASGTVVEETFLKPRRLI
jgi:hypothetical protein